MYYNGILFAFAFSNCLHKIQTFQQKQLKNISILLCRFTISVVQKVKCLIFIWCSFTTVKIVNVSQIGGCPYSCQSMSVEKIKVWT